ncbi:11907_t:CDS:2, partial [Racocetra fulgida]
VLQSLNGDTKRCIIEWSNIVQAKYSSDDVDSDDDDNITYYGDSLLIIEWNEIGLIQRNIQKNTVVNCCNPFPGASLPPSDSLFYIVDMQNILAQQIINKFKAAKIFGIFSL